MIVAGRLESEIQGKSILRLAEALDWPVLPDVASQVRLGPDAESLVPYYEMLLSDEQFGESQALDAVLHFGGRALSKRLEQFLARATPDPYVVVRENPFRLDPGHQVTQSVEAEISGFCEALIRAAEKSPASGSATWKTNWRTASKKVGKRLGQLLDAPGELSEPFVARFVSRNIPEEHGLVLASSMPVRDFDTYAAPDGPVVPVAVNRGASGIDGTVATAAGFARGSGRPVTLLIGDLALLHDLNSLSMLRGLPVVVVVLNNDGGGIFSFLPVAQNGEFFEPYFGTPHGLGFEDAAAMFGLNYEQPGTVKGFADAYKAACDHQTPTLIEVRTNREENVALHQELLKKFSVGRLT